jgi:hypothetical protein
MPLKAAGEFYDKEDGRAALALQLRYKEPPGSQISQRSEVICPPGTPRRAGARARATALSG